MTALIYTREELKLLIAPFIKKNISGRMDISQKKISQQLKEQIILSTHGCRDERFSERIYWILNDIYEYPTCAECGKQFQPRFYGLKDGYKNQKFCSNKCAANNKEIKQKTAQTNLQKYNSEYIWQSQYIKQKIKQTCLEKYGVEYISQLSEIKEKKKQNNFQKYKVYHISQLQIIKNKKKQTCVERYGVENVFQSLEIKQKIKQTCLERYGTEFAMQSVNIFDKSCTNSRKTKWMTLPSGKEISYQRI